MLADDLKRNFHYDAETGEFTRLVTRVHNAKAGQKAGCKNVHGYLVFNVGGKVRYAHRMAWLYVYGSEPAKGFDIDHINENKADNRIANLRMATRAQNNHNRAKPQKNNTTGRAGIRLNRGARGDRWSAWITIDGRMRTLGTYATKDEAIAARIQGEIAHHKQFRRDTTCAHL
jgi:hypothetical protein